MLNNHKTYSKSNLRDVQKTFTDGVCYLYSAEERTITNTIGKFFYANESVGYGHYWEAYNNNISLDRAISIPYNNLTIDTQNIVMIDDVYYNISRIQFKDSHKPKYWILSLSKAQFSYEVNV